MSENIELLLREWVIPEDITYFKDNDIKTEQLSQLTDDILKELCPRIGIWIELKRNIDDYLTSMTNTETNPSVSTNLDHDDLTDLQDIITADLYARPGFPEFDLKKSKYFICINMDDHTDEIIFLKNNNEQWSQVIDCWNDTFELRKNTPYNNISDFIEEWNILNDPRSDSLINLDFEMLYPERPSFYKNWKWFINKIISLNFGESKDDILTSLYETIQQQPDDDQKLPNEIKLLCYLIPPRGRLNKHRKFSTLECIENFIIDVQNPGDIQNKIEEVKKKALLNKQSIQPYIIKNNPHDDMPLKLSTDEPLQLGPPPRTCYPLVVILARDVRDTGELRPDDTVALVSVVHIRDEQCSLPSGIIAQYLKQANGHLSCLKQLYVTGECGGGEGYTASAEGAGGGEEEALCCVCAAQPLSRALLPCRHACLCARCLPKLDKCPICRSVITSYFCIRNEEEPMTELKNQRFPFNRRLFNLFHYH